MKKRQRDMRGKVERRRLRRPKVSIVKKAGMAKRKFRAPKPRDAPRAESSERLASRKIWEE